MDELADTGEIFSQRVLKIQKEDDAGSLYAKMTKTALSQLAEFLPLLESGRFVRRSQAAGCGNKWRKRNRKDGQIDWRMSAISIHNLVRGLTRPYVGAHFILAEQEIKIWKTEVIEHNEANIEPGKVLASDSQGVIVKTNEGAIRLIEIEPAVNISAGEYL